MVIRDWAWWRLPPLLRVYVGALPVLAIAAIAIQAARTDWHMTDLGKFLLLMSCGTISVASTPRIMYTFPGLTRDFSSIWVLPTAILLPPIYAALVPISVVAALHFCVHRGVMHRMVFTAATLSLSYLAASLAFRLFPASFAGGAVGVGWHAFTWCLAVAACEILGCRAQHFMIVGAVKLSDPTMRIWSMEWDRDALQALFVEIDLGVLITLAVALSPALVLIAFPTVLLVRRFLVFPVLEAQSRVDAKTGLLNVSTWEREAEAELSRAGRSGTPLALALLDIDHFKAVNDTYGHLVGDKVLRAVADALTAQLRSYDRAGRFGGEEFVLLLPQTGEADARGIAERLRRHVADMTVPIDGSESPEYVSLTISIGVSSTEGATCELTDLLAAADAALYYAKQNGRNMTHVFSAAPLVNENGQVVDRRDAIAGLRQADPAGASLCPAMSLCVPVRAQAGAARAMAQASARSPAPIPHPRPALPLRPHPPPARSSLLRQTCNNNPAAHSVAYVDRDRLRRIRTSLTPREWVHMSAMSAVVILLHVVGWVTLLAIVVPGHYSIGTQTFGAGIGITAYTLGARHAFDADHISAIDNTTRKLMADGKRPLSVGFFFSLGHSSVVFVLSLLLSLGVRALAGPVRDGSSGLHRVTTVVGTGVSGLFLYLIAAINLVVLAGIMKVFRELRRGRFDEQTLEAHLNDRGFLNKLFGKLMRSIRHPRQMYGVGLLFGLGFDTATEVALLVLAGTGAAGGLPWYAILCLPVLFAAGMSLLDTIDGSFMNFAYGWAFSNPVRKVYYNITITGLSVVMALLIGTVELAGLLGQEFSLGGPFWTWVEGLNINTLGFFIVGLFAATWALAMVIWRAFRIEQRFGGRTLRHPRELPEAAE